jgi:hypothetical protein
VAKELLCSRETAGQVCRHDTWTTFNDEKDLVDSQPYKSSGDSYIFLYRRDDIAEVEFPPLGPQVNMEERVGNIVDTFPSDLLQSLDTRYVYQSRFTDMLLPITRQELHEVRVALMGEIIDLKYEVQHLKDKIVVSQQQNMDEFKCIRQLLDRHFGSYGLYTPSS